MVTIRIEPGAFLELIRAGWEVDHRESIGILFGHTIKRHNLVYVVETVHPSQRALRLPTEAKLDGKSKQRCYWTLDTVEHILGLFHTHHGYWNSKGKQRAAPLFSKEDHVDYFENEADYVELVLAYNHINSYRYPHHTSTTLSGTHIFDDQVNEVETEPLLPKRYHIRIVGYYWEKSTGNRGGRAKRAKLDIEERVLREFFKKPR